MPCIGGSSIGAAARAASSMPPMSYIRLFSLTATFDKSIALAGRFDKEAALSAIFDKNFSLLIEG